ncbi:hypothetical protein MCOR27_007848 [Pyricularia oryzae]|uniref:Fatty acid transporter protein n=2 Tax=Pyricularia TaxID=48558 RepID=A0ABQ8NFM8_PYRGI|nr:hypothetical protein MCOR01_011706 [Pyricularia oryzae]KAI6296320.1 hypothetical protein MCOR33_007051 [Pyricularia grisea]KAH9440058.1 hypothetical protein MCOR02_003587 [Pyricularia oryzae]KAI6259663.1 hypothetical protein MCOR19_004016 [Pyricularia oryzae]KAI6273478.1 hypothetical protein MCOR27_007848 [Pyricularia oryzae]
MPVPLAIAAPAAAAGLAYLNAKAQIWYDGKLARSVLPSIIRMALAEYTGRTSLFYMLEERAQDKSSAGRVFIRFGDHAYTYAEVYTIALRYGNWIQKTYGVKPHDVVAMDFMNSDQFVFMLFGLWSIGAKPAFINYNLRERALSHCVAAAKSRVCFIDPAVADALTDYLRDGLPETKFVLFTPEVVAEVMATEPIRPPDEVRYETQQHAMAILIYTSGTTGLPKAAVVSWAKMIVAGGFTSRLLNLQTTDVYYTCMPLYHSTATLMGLGAVLTAGSTLALGVKFSTKNFWNDVRHYDATIIQYVGETCRYLLSAPTIKDPATGEILDKKHRVHTAHGNGLRPDVWNKFKERFGVGTIVEFYGATEGSFATYNVSTNDFSAGAIGRNGWLYSLILSYSIAFVEVDYNTDLPRRDPKTGFCKRSKSGEPGEFIFKLPANDHSSRFQGYYGNKEATEAKIMRNVFSKGDAWLRTGDVIRADNEGRLFFHDRIGDTFRWKGENVSTQEVSLVLGRHDSIKEANVYGVTVPNHDGRAGCAALTLSDALATEKKLGDELLKGLATHSSTSLPKFAVPQFLRVVRGEMQSTGTNKQQKHDLRVQGVEPGKVGVDEVYWLRGGTYVPFGTEDWDGLKKGLVKL